MKDWNTPHPDTPLKIAKLVMWVTGPLNQATAKAARVVFENKRLNRDNPVDESQPRATRNLNTPHADTDASRLTIAKLLLWVSRPLNRPTLWAAQTMIENKMRNSGIPVKGARS